MRTDLSSVPARPRPGTTDPAHPRTTGCAAPSHRDARAQVLLDVMARVQDGDHDAFRDLHDLTTAAALATAVRTTWSAEHAAEVVQEVYLHVWRHATDYVPERGPVLRWLLMLVHRRAVDRVRSVSSAALRDQRDFDRSDATAPDVADLGIARHEARGLRAAVELLSPKQRDAVTLTYLHGYTTNEAAALLRVPVGTVKSRVRDGIIVLRTQLAERAA